MLFVLIFIGLSVDSPKTNNLPVLSREVAERLGKCEKFPLF
jgi:hypothetical protein